MAEKEDVIEMPLGTKEIADTLKISESVIRKYALALEKSGYEFDRSGTARLFKHHDIESFRMINKLTENSKLNVEHAVAVVMARNTQTTSSVASETSIIPTTRENNSQYANNLVAVENQLKMQRNLIDSMVEMMAKQNEETERRHDELMDKLNKQTEINKDLNDKLSLAVDLIQKLDSKVDKIEENEKKGFFKRLFG